MARLTSFNNFINENSSNHPVQPKSYIYVLKYILGKENYIDEIKEYILNYSDDETDYEDMNKYDKIMKLLKIYASQNRFDEIEDLVFNYEEYSYSDDFDEYDEDFEEKMYYADDFAKNQEVYSDYDDISFESDIPFEIVDEDFTDSSFKQKKYIENEEYEDDELLEELDDRLDLLDMEEEIYELATEEPSDESDEDDLAEIESLENELHEDTLVDKILEFTTDIEYDEISEIDIEKESEEDDSQ